MKCSIVNSKMSEIRFSIYPHERCRNEFIAFRNANREVQRDDAYFEWRFLKRPGSIRPLFLWAETASGEKIGSLSLVPHDYVVNGAPLRLGILGDISVSGQWRGKGVAGRMFDYLAAANVTGDLKTCIVLPNHEAARPLEKTGWKKVTRLERYVKVLRSEDSLGRLLGKDTLAKALSPALNAAFKLSYGEVFVGPGSGYKGAVTNTFDGRFDGLWEALDKENVILGMRNREYLTWRYSMHPATKYDVFALTFRDELCGYMVFNINCNNCYVVDMLCLDGKRHSGHLLYHFIDFIRKNGRYGSIVLRANKSDFLTLPLRRFGFMRRSDAQDFMVNFYNEPKDSDFLLDGRKWYLTSGDKDV